MDVLTINVPSKTGLRTQVRTPCKRLRSNNGGKYTSVVFTNYAAKHGVALEPTRPYSPQTNGVAKRDLWAEALAAFFDVKNRSPHAALNGRVPLSVWRGKPVCIDHLRFWGCQAWRTITHGCAKLDARAVPLIFVGYDGDTAAYRLFEPSRGRTIRSQVARPGAIDAGARSAASRGRPVASGSNSLPSRRDVAALAAAARDSLSASDDACTLPTSDPRSHAGAVRDVDAAA
ncbi:uncharacterized protein JCM10292_000445 [Rhodotorula paludigena]|uniref:uncharacterized protein n=1 Tax=Rhodotorula paludigena TaxID=86838 RepID=UPI00317CC9E2